MFTLPYISHGRKSNLVEFEILPVEIPIEEIWVLPWVPKCNEIGRQSNCSKSGGGDSTASFTCWDQQLGSCDKKCCSRSMGLNRSTKCHVESDCCQNLTVLPLENGDGIWCWL